VKLPIPVNLKVHSISGVAKEKIEKAGGTVEIIEG
jgi:Ribosomal protein L18e/L15.